MRILAATLLTAVVLTLGGGVAVAIPAEAASVYLVSTRDFTVSCLAMRGPSTVETVDVVFEVKMGGSGRVTVWQATDGYQFQVIPVPQNQPWGCVPLKSPIEAPAEWARD